MLNCIVLQGRLTKDVELRHTLAGTAVATIGLAVQRSKKDQNGEYPADFIDVVLWGKTAEHVSRFFHKGELMIVRGRLEGRKWQDKNGNKHLSWEVQADGVEFGESKKKKNASSMDIPADDFEANDDPVDIPSDDFSELDDNGDVPF